MLKWLVTKAPSSPTSLESVVTDDPLATLNERKDKNEPIYAVSRVNPIFEEEDSKDINDEVNENVTSPSDGQENSSGNLPDSPPTDRESVRSSGYGSKEADSVSFKSDSPDDEELHGRLHHESELKDVDNEDEGSLSLESPGTVAEIRRSFENLSSLGKASSPTSSVAYSPSSVTEPNPTVEIVTKNPNYVKSIEIGSKASSPLEVILEVSHESEGTESPGSKKSSWPRVSHMALSLQRQADRIHNRRDRERLKQMTAEEEAEKNNRAHVLRFNPLVSVVAQNRRYVTAISLSPNNKAQNEAIQSDQQTHDSHQQGGRFHLGVTHSEMPTSLTVNNNYYNNEYPLISLQPDSLINEDTLQMMNYPNYGSYSRKSDDLSTAEGVAPGDMPDFGRAMYSSFYSMKSGSSASQESLNSRRERNHLSHNSASAKKKGVNVVKDLWEKTGLKTNGRKLLVDVHDLINEDRPTSHSRKTSYGSIGEDDYRSIPSTSTNNSTHHRKKKDVIRTISGKSLDAYENISSFPHSYEEIYEDERGIDNLGFQDDRGMSRGSTTSSLHSRTSGWSGHPFQHNLTDFQRRVSERVQGEPNHRKSWFDVEKGMEPSEEDLEHSSRSLRKTKESRHFPSNKKKKNYPGKAVRELGLEDFKKHDRNNFGSNGYARRSTGSVWTLSDPNSGSMGKKNRIQIWDQFYGRYKDGSISGGYFFPHPNSEAPICANRGGFCHDFTLDPKRSHRMLEKSTREKRRRMCCLGVLVFISFVAFVGAIIGLAWFSSIGQSAPESV